VSVCCVAQLWAGLLNYRCRLTEFPVVVPAGELLRHNFSTEATFFAAFAAYYSGTPSNATTAYVESVLHNRTAYPFCGALTVRVAVNALDAADGWCSSAVLHSMACCYRRRTGVQIRSRWRIAVRFVAAL
jgi:hypothetical protein